MAKYYMHHALRLIIAGLLGYAAFQKLNQPQAASPTRTVLDAWSDGSPAFRYALVVIEFGIAMWLIAGITPRTTALCAIILFSAFSGALAVEIKRPHPRPCGCMGAEAALYEPSAIRESLALGLARNGTLMVAAAVLFLAAPVRASDQKPDSVKGV